MTKTTEAFPHSLTSQSLTFYVEGKPTQAFRDNPKFSAILTAVLQGDPKAVEMARPAIVVAANLTAAINDAAEGSNAERWFRRAEKALVVSEWGVTYGGDELHGTVVDRLMEILGVGGDTSAWVRFITKLQQNPSSTSRNELYGWLENSEMPITSDGDFLAYKRVSGNYRDIHSGKFDNSVGQVVSMSRLDVDDDRNRTCSAGLHFCSKSYLPSFGRGSVQGGDHIMIVKINPADVVSIPSDYNDAKGRTWRYEVVGEITLEDAGLNVWSGPVVSDYDGDFDSDADWDDDYDDFDYDEDEGYGVDDDEDDEDPDDEAGDFLRGAVFSAYSAMSGVKNHKVSPAREARLFAASLILGRIVESFNGLTNSEARDLISAWS